MHNLKSLLFCVLLSLSALNLTAIHAQLLPSIDVPTNFTLDREVASRLRPALLRESEEPTGSSAIGIRVLQHLVEQALPKSPSVAWELRIAKRAGELNAFSSPDGTIYVDRSLAQLLGSQPGLWAAALSHEVAHILHRDWARRYLYERSMRNDNLLVVGELGTPGAWVDPATSARLSSTFSRQMEISADTEGLMLMARAGYHPDFMLSLLSLLRAHAVETKRSTFDARHPEWSLREEVLRTIYASAGHEYERLWPEMSDSPGGSPPIVVSTGEPVTRKQDVNGAEVLIPLRCSNLSGAVEVVLQLRDKDTPQLVPEIGAPSEWRQFTGCTSDVTQITFRVAANTLLAHGRSSAGIYVIDDRGELIAASDVFKLKK